MKFVSENQKRAYTWSYQSFILSFPNFELSEISLTRFLAWLVIHIFGQQIQVNSGYSSNVTMPSVDYESTDYKL